MTLEIIGAGFGRTGTMSLKVALEELGFGPCYHMTEVFANPDHVELWETAARGEPLDWGEVFRDYRATVDWPGAAFYEELMRRYPEPRMKRMRRVALMAADLAWKDLFDGRFEDRRHAIEVFDRWNEEVKERVPAE